MSTTARRHQHHPVLKGAGVLSASLLGCVLLLAPSDAAACTAPACAPGAALPASGALPANLQSFLLRPPTQGAGDFSAAPRLFRIDANGQRVELELTQRQVERLWLLSPKLPVPVGTELSLEWSQPCDEATYAQPAEGKRVSVRAMVMPEKALPRALGKLGVDTQQGRVSVPSSASCSEGAEAAYADLSVELSSDSQPYQDLLRYSLRVDGKEVSSYRDATGWPTKVNFGGSSLGRGKDRIYTFCAGQDPNGLSLAAGKHRVSMVGLLPDGTQIASDEVEVELRCGDAPEAGSSATPTAPPDATARPQAAAASTSTAPTDAPAGGGAPQATSPGSNGSSEAAASSETEGSDDESANDDGCTLGPRRRSPAWGALVVVICALLLRVRRGTRRVHAR